MLYHLFLVIVSLSVGAIIGVIIMACITVGHDKIDRH